MARYRRELNNKLGIVQEFDDDPNPIQEYLNTPIKTTDPFILLTENDEVLRAYRKLLTP